MYYQLPDNIRTEIPSNIFYLKPKEDWVIQIYFHGNETGEFNGKLRAKAIFGKDYV